jgi:hypothetical protein
MVTRKERETASPGKATRRPASPSSRRPVAKPGDAALTPKFSSAAKQAAWRLISPP